MSEPQQNRPVRDLDVLDDTRFPAPTGGVGAPAEPLTAEDALVEAAIDATSIVEIFHGQPELRFHLGKMREGFRRAFGRISGSCLLCGVDKFFAVYQNGVGVCEQCRAKAQQHATQQPALRELKDALRNLDRFEADEVEGADGYFLRWSDVARLLVEPGDQ